MRINVDEFRRKYPNLAREILDGEGLGINLVIDRREYRLDDPWRGYMPGIEDYLRRCRNVEEAYEVIMYLEKQGEISSEDAKRYREIIEKHGLEYFGPRKEDDYYYRKAHEYWRKKSRKKTISQQ